MQALLRNEAHERRQEELRKWLEHPELGVWRQHYVKFFAGKLHTTLPGQPIHVDYRDERRFTESLNRRHTENEKQRIKKALDDMHGLFFEAFPGRYTLYPNHVESLRDAENIVGQIETPPQSS